jgi:class 3 adenylate cyclase
LAPGLHVGECEMRGTDVSGLAVHIAARVAEVAGPGEILVSSTVMQFARFQSVMSYGTGTDRNCRIQ